jgi:hypothetical protein
MALINAILDGLGAIVAGNISSAANFVEQALAKAIPVAIGFLASLLGLGGFSDKIKQIMNAIRGPINKAIDWVLKTVVKPVVRLAMRAVSWVGGKIDKAKDWGKKKWDAAKVTAKKKWEGVKSRAKGARKPEKPGPDQPGTVSVGFSMHGASHKLTVTTGPAPAITMASSRPGELGAKMAQALGSAQKQKQAIEEARQELATLTAERRKPARRAALKCFVECAEKRRKGSGTSQVEELDQIATLKVRVNQLAFAKPPKKGPLTKALKQLAARLESYANHWNLSDLGPMAERPPKDIGEGMPYGEAKSGRAQEFGTLEAEHIAPGKILNILVRGLSGRRLYTDKAYQSAFTLLIPEMMADIKTHEGAVPSPSDQTLIRRVKAAAERVSKQIKKGDAVAPADVLQLNDLFTNRGALTSKARDAAIARLLAGTDGPKGKAARERLAVALQEQVTDAAINRTVITQLQEVWDLAKRAQSSAGRGAKQEASGDCVCPR